MENPAAAFFSRTLFESGKLNKPLIFASNAFHRGFIQRFLRMPADLLQ
jgi:hypothetical protein